MKARAAEKKHYRATFSNLLKPCTQMVREMNDIHELNPKGHMEIVAVTLTARA